MSEIAKNTEVIQLKFCSFYDCIYPGSRAFEFTSLKREREEGSGELCTKSHSQSRSRDQATGRPSIFRAFPVFEA